MIRSFRGRKLYRGGRNEAQSSLKPSPACLREKRCSLTGQIRRSSWTTQSMLAEAWARRRYPVASVSQLTDALAEATETQSWRDEA